MVKRKSPQKRAKIWTQEPAENPGALILAGGSNNREIGADLRKKTQLFHENREKEDAHGKIV